MRTARTFLDTVERFLWFAVAAAIGAMWAFYEVLTGREVPGHAHPILGTLVATALSFGGVDLRRISRARQFIAGVSGIPPEIREHVAQRIAQLESEEPEVLHALQELAKENIRRDATLQTPPRKRTRKTMVP